MGGNLPDSSLSDLESNGQIQIHVFAVACLIEPTETILASVWARFNRNLVIWSVRAFSRHPPFVCGYTPA